VRAIDETGSLSAAARLLGYSQPAVSQHLQRAETKLGMQLIIRSGRSARLSEAGHLVSGIAPSVIGEVDAALARIRGLSELRSGTVSVTAFPSASSTLVPALLSSLRTSSPGISLSYTEAEPPESLQLLADGRADLAIVCSYAQQPLDAEWLARHNITVHDLFVDPIYLILPHDHPLAGAETVELIDMEDDEWIAGCPRCRQQLVDWCSAVGYEPEVSMSTDNFSAVLGLVAAGLGVAALPRLAIGTAAIPKGAVVRQSNPRDSRSIGFAVTDEAAMQPAVRATMSALLAIDGSPWRLQRPQASTLLP
jgi:DNA-binding transcriptional LysR family regulator